MKTKTNQDNEAPKSVSGTTVTETSTPPVAHGTDISHAELAAENEQLKATIRLNAAHRQITGELARAGARSPELLFDAAKGDLQFAEDGTLTNAAAIVERLEAAFPEQFADDPPIGPIDGGAGRAAVPALTKDALAKMSPAEIARLDWAAVRQALTEK
ncbi:MAG: hypothetical protein KA746_00295 [Pyrinomonadaceae bacterium]|nr:hypothetical protein [Pyrinomonadaceae bacterium]MBP6213425.1 hypothetical protein [Pyrinomonadaceae bacterium]